ncbi:TPA: glycosyltransferase [Vibrio vulnificus]|nr:glycosyltransferase [Vibrio vulnificus]
MKVLHVVFNLSDYSGAAFQAKLIKTALDSNINSDILSIETNKDINISGDFTSVYKKKYISLLLVLLKKIWGSDIVHIHGFSIFALSVALFLRKKVILKTTLNGSDDLETIYNSKYSALKIFLARRVSKNVVLSINELAINTRYIDRQRIVKIPNSVVLPSVDVFNKDKTMFCSVGIMSERKGFIDSIRYFKKNYSHIPGAKLYIIGPLPKFGEEREDCSYKYYESCLSEATGHNVFFTGKISKIELNAIYKKSQAFLFFSKREGMPNVLLEAMAYNCVPITGEIGGVASEIIEDKVSGFIVDFDEVIYLDQIEKISLAREPYLRVQSRNDIEVISKIYRNLYESIY